MSNAAIIDSPPEDVAAALQRLGVSRETLDRFALHLRLLTKWQPTINLVGPATLADAWHRHVLDSVQLFPLLPPESRVLVDLGSGAGFPGMTLALMGIESVHLIESDARKAAFLREVARETSAPVTVHAKRVDAVRALVADTVTARALAPLTDLVSMSLPFMAPTGVCLFPKGRTAEDELTAAGQSWRMQVERFNSVTDRSATILRLSEISATNGGRRP